MIHVNNYQTDQVIESFMPAYDPSRFEKYINPETKPSNDIEEHESHKFKTNIEKILIDPEPGSFTAIFGARATFKTSLILKFLYNSNKEQMKAKGDSLLLSLVDNLGTLKDICYCPMAKKYSNSGDKTHKANCIECHKNFYLFHQRSGCVASHEFFYNIDKRISEHEKKTGKKIARLAFWDLTQLEYRFPLLAADPMFLPGLVEYTKKNKIALIVMGAGNSKLTPAASAIADNVIFCWRTELNSDNLEIPFAWNKVKNKNLKNRDELLCIYVDRCQGHLGNEGKELTFIPVNKEQGIDIECPGVKLLEDNKENFPNGFQRVELSDYDLILNAKQTIDTITNMQGMGAVTR